MTRYLLDTNVVSELIKSRPDERVVAWIRATDEADLHLSVLTFAEIRYGIEKLTQSARRERLQRWMDIELADRFEDKILDVDRGVAELWGVIMARAAIVSVRLPVMDTLLAATAEHHGMTMVTRNVRDFARAGVATLDPWSGA
ncbi:MAG TPA: type II toxin-antitoxin system VapC family toxin [Stellaceae bacterium]